MFHEQAQGWGRIEPETGMKPRLAGISLLLFGLSVILWLSMTVFESALAGMSPGAERVLILLFLIVPPGIGAAFGVMSLRRKEGGAWLAATGILLNSLFALFHTMIILFAG